jgi:hypothetical protein
VLGHVGEADAEFEQRTKLERPQGARCETDLVQHPPEAIAGPGERCTDPRRFVAGRCAAEDNSQTGGEHVRQDVIGYLRTFESTIV